MSDMIQINIQAILDKSSEATILESIKNIRTQVEGKPLTLKVTTDNVALNTLMEKMQTITKEASKPIVINAEGNITRVITTFGEDLTKFKTKAIETSKGIGDLTRSIQTLNAKTGEYANSTKVSQNLDQQKNSVDRLEASQLRLLQTMEKFKNIPEVKPMVQTATNSIMGLNQNSTAVDKQDISNQVSAITQVVNKLKEEKMMLDEIKATQLSLSQSMSKMRFMPELSAESQGLINKIDGLNHSNYSMESVQVLKNEVATYNQLATEIEKTYTVQQKQSLAIQSTTEKYNLLFAEVRAGASSVKLTEEQMTLLQEKLSAITVGPEAFNQLESLKTLMASMRSETNINFVSARDIENTRLENVELQRQIALFQERNQLAMRNIQSQFGRLSQTPAVQSQISAINASSGSLSNATDINEFRTQSAQVTSATNNMRAGLNEARSASHNFGSDLLNNAVKMAQWTIVGGLIFGTLTKIKEGFTFINTLDKSMTNISMITGITRDSVMEMTKAYADLATQLHSTTGEVMKSAEEFLRAGHTQEETLKLIQSATVMGAIAGQDSKSSADQLIAITNGFKMDATDAMDVVDKLTTVDNMSATSTKELGDALERTSVSAQMAGTSFSDLVSYIGTVSSVSRKSASSIGESFKTMFARFQDVKGGKNFDAENQDISNVERDFQKYANISIRSTSGEFKDFSVVINELSSKWNTLSEVEQSATAKALAGTRQRENFLILMNNMDTALKLQSAELDSSGSAMTRYAEKSKSTEARLNDLTNAIQKIWLNLLSSSAINSTISGFTGFITSIGNTISVFGGLNSALYLVIATLGILKGQAIMGTIIAIQEYAISFGVAETATYGLGAALDFLMANPILLAVAAVVAVTTALVGYANQQAKIKEQLDITTKSQIDFNSAIQQFQDTLDPKKLEDVATALAHIKDAVKYDDTVKQIQQLKTEIDGLQSKNSKNVTGDIGGEVELAQLEEKKKKLAELEGSIKPATEDQKLFDEQKKISTALDYQSVEAGNQKIALKIRENSANKQLIDSYQKVYDKLSKGTELTKEESALNQKMIDKYPEYTKVLNDKTDAIGINITMLQSNQTAQEALALIEFNEMKTKVESSKIATQSIINDTTTRIEAIGAEMKAIEAANAQLASNSTLTYDEKMHAGILNDNATANATAMLAEANKKLNMAKLTIGAYDTLGSLSFADLSKAPTSSSFNPPDGPPKKTPAETAAEKLAARQTETGTLNSSAFVQQIEDAATKFNVPATLVDAIMKQESSYNPKALSPSGAIGLMQLMPSTAKSLGVNPYDTTQNIEGGTKYIKQLMDEFKGNIPKAVAAYNAGPGAVQKYNGTPPYAETQDYVKKVMATYDSHRIGADSQSSPNYVSPNPKDQISIEDSLIRSFQTQVNITAQEEKLLNKQLASVKSAKDYTSELNISNSLLENQTTQVSQLGTSTSKIQAEFAKLSTASGFADTASWFDSAGEATLLFQQRYNDTSSDLQANMKNTFDELSKLQKAYLSNSNAVDTLNLSIETLKTSLTQLEIDQYNNTISSVDTHLSQSKSTMDLYNISSKEYTQEQKNQTLSLKNKQDAIDEEIAKVKDQLTNTKLTAEATNILIDQMSKLSLDSASNKKAMSDSSTSQLDNQYQIQQKQNSELETSLSLQLQIQEAVQPKNYDMINVILQSQISAQNTNLTQIQQSIDATIALRDATDKTSASWQVLNDKASAFQSTLQSAMTTLSATYKSQLDNQTNSQLHTAELSIFGGQTETQAKQVLQNKMDYQSNYISGEEKAASILRIQNQLQQDNASLNLGVIDSQKNILQFSQDQLAILNSTADIKRSDLDLMEKQLQIQKTQAELANEQNNKTIQQLTKKSDGTFDYTYVADQTKVLATQGTLYQEQQDLAKTKLDNQNKEDQLLLNQKSTYLGNIKTVVQNALNGEYADTSAFNNAMLNANGGFLSSMQGSNASIWSNISSNVTGNISVMLSAYQNYVSQMAILQATANAIAMSKLTTPLAVPATSSSSQNLSNGNTRVYDNGPSGWTEYNSSGVAVGAGTSKGYSTGGETSATELAILHGKAGAPERVLSSEQTSSFNTLVKNLPSITTIMDKIMSGIKNPLTNINLPSLPDISSFIKSAQPSSTSQTYHIDNISFPNILDATGIKSALDNLPSYVLQRTT